MRKLLVMFNGVKKKLTFFLICFLFFPILSLYFFPVLAEGRDKPGPLIKEGEIGDIAREILVKFKSDNGVKTVEVPYGENLEKFLEKYNNSPEVLYAEPNYLYHQVSVVPNDPYYGNQWYLQKIKAPTAWENVSQSPRVIIAIIDSGIET
ncbi:MAG: hypothetical protein PHP21_05070, partial [Patescibacteria group bacterium]|nr:hypothetical protein [Patescibacteria group bacterium]